MGDVQKDLSEVFVVRSFKKKLCVEEFSEHRKKALLEIKKEGDKK